MKATNLFSLVVKDLWWVLVPSLLCLISVFNKTLLTPAFGISLILLTLWLIRLPAEAEHAVRKAFLARLSFARFFIFLVLVIVLGIIVIITSLTKVLTTGLKFVSPFTIATILILASAFLASFAFHRRICSIKPDNILKIIRGFSGFFIPIDFTGFIAFDLLLERCPSFKFLVFVGMIAIAISVLYSILTFSSSLGSKTEKQKKLTLSRFAVASSSLVGGGVIFFVGKISGMLLKYFLGLA